MAIVVNKNFTLATLFVVGCMVAIQIEASISIGLPALGDNAEDWSVKMTDEFNKLIQKCDALAKEAHDRLKHHSLDNPYEKLLNQHLRYLEHLCKRAKDFRSPDNQYLKNPFMKKLAEYTKNDLEFMTIQYKKIIEMYDSGNDRSFPVLTALVEQIVELAQKDIGYIKNNNSTYADMIQAESRKLETQLEALSSESNLETAIEDLVMAMSRFQNDLIDVEMKTNINRIPQ